MEKKINMTEKDRLMAQLNTQGKRFEYWIKDVQRESLNSFAQLVGMPDSGPVYSIVKDKVNFSKVTLTRILDKFPDFPKRWIQTGEGDIPGLKKQSDIINEEITFLKDELKKKDDLIALLVKDKEEINKIIKSIKEFVDEQRSIIDHQQSTIKDQEKHIKDLTLFAKR